MSERTLDNLEDHGARILAATSALNAEIAAAIAAGLRVDVAAIAMSDCSPPDRQPGAIITALVSTPSGCGPIGETE